LPQRAKLARARGSDSTKSAILEAARQQFAAEGYDRATIRAIAADAEIDPALVIRYFGNKEKLFGAAAEFNLALPDMAALPRWRVGTAVVEHFVDTWERDDTFMALLRVAATNDGAAKRVRTVLVGQVAPMIAVLGDPAEAATRAGLVASQILVMALCRYVLRLPPLVAMSRDEIVKALGPTVQRYIVGNLTLTPALS
jgi:AcrR family transcriptional regulator